jgi:hypothetical protein
LQQKQKENPFKSEQNQQMIREEERGVNLSILLSLYPKNFGYSLGGYSHRERYRAPDRNKLTKENTKELWLHCQQNIDYSHREVFTKS